MKLRKVFLLPLVAFGLVACSEATANESSQSSPETSESGNNQTDKATLLESYVSEGNLSYMNMRPTYNYYTTTFKFEVIDLYSDNTYCLTHSSSTYSALILPDEGNDATGNERENSIIRYFGTYSKTADDLDEDTSHLTLNTPNRIIGNYDSQYVVDTANFKPVEEKNGQGQVSATYNTAAEYYQAHAFNTKQVTLSNTSIAIEYFEIKGASETVTNGELKNIGETINNSYMSDAGLLYMNMRPNYNFYLTAFVNESIELLDASTYRLNIYSCTFSGLGLPAEGNEVSGSPTNTYKQSFYGTYTKKANDLDEDAAEITFAAPTRATLTKDGMYGVLFVDTDNWNDAAKNATSSQGQDGSTVSYNTGAEYISSLGFDASKKATVAEGAGSFAYTQFATPIYL